MWPELPCRIGCTPQAKIFRRSAGHGRRGQPVDGETDPRNAKVPLQQANQHHPWHDPRGIT